MSNRSQWLSQYPSSQDTPRSKQRVDRGAYMARRTPLAHAAILAVFACVGFDVEAQVTGTAGTNGSSFVNCVGGVGCGNGYGVVPSGSAAGAGGAALTVSGTQTNSTTATGGVGGNGGNNTTSSFVFGIGPPGGGGGAGGEGATGSSFNLTNSSGGSLIGGLGGNGGTGAGGVSSGGVGGTGGTGGVGASGTGYTLSNAGTITGGAGGIGGTGGASNGPGGTGGTGGAGVSGSGFALTNTSTITGGAGGTGGVGNGSGAAGAIGVGGVGVISTGSSTITNSGTISSGGGSANAISLSGGGNVLTLQSASVINGSIASTSGSTNGGDTINIASGAQVNGGVSLLAGSTLNASGATLTGRLSNAGTTVIAAGQNLAVNSFTNTGTFRTSVASMSSYGQLTVTGTATLGGTLYVDTASASGLVSGTLGSVISAGSISGTFATTETDSLLFTFAPVYTATDVNITVASVLPNIYATTSALGNSPASGAAQTLDQILADAPTGAIALQFMGFSTGQEQALSDAVSQTLPSLIGGGIQATQATLSDINHVVQGRLSHLRGMPSGDAMRDRNVWVKPFGSAVKQDDQGAVAGYKAETFGVVGGADASVSSSLRLGVGLAYASSELKSASSVLNHTTDVSLWQLIGYGSQSLDAVTDLDFQIDLGRNSNTSSRAITFASSVASADYNTTSAHAGVGLTRLYALTDKTTLSPMVRADYTWIKDAAYAETGAGAFNLNVDSRTAKGLVVAVGAKLAHALTDAWSVSTSGALAYDVNHDQAVTNAAYAGASSAKFATYGISPKPLTMQVGLGAEYKLHTGTRLLFALDAEHRSGFDNMSASVNARWAF